MRRIAFIALVATAVGCGSSAGTDSAFPGGFAADAPGGSTGGAGAAPAEPGAAPEREVESDYEAPVATGHFVWIANPKSGRVALVDVASLAVKTVEAGNGPTTLAKVPGNDDATLVLNVLSEDATLLRATAAGDIIATTFKTASRANSLAFSADGRFAIAWTDGRKIASALSTQGFQDLAILDLASGTSTILAVGYRPVLVGFAAGGAYAVTQDGISIVDLAGAPHMTQNVAISDTPTDDPGTRDVFVTKDGATAFVRRDGSPDITVVALATGVRSTVTLNGPVTDLDLADSGDRAVAVVRSTATVAVLPTSAPATFATVTVTGETIGSVAIAAGGTRAMLYTNAVPDDRFTILDLANTTDKRTVRLYAPVLGIFGTPDARHAVVLHDKTTEGGNSFSLVPIANLLPARIVAMSAPALAVATDDDRVVVAERDDAAKVYGAYLGRLPELRVDRFPLASPPTAVGIVPNANRAYVAQAHPEGRITFVDLDTGLARTLTGFELSARVVDGSQP